MKFGARRRVVFCVCVLCFCVGELMSIKKACRGTHNVDLTQSQMLQLSCLYHVVVPVISLMLICLTSPSFSFLSCHQSFASLSLHQSATFLFNFQSFLKLPSQLIVAFLTLLSFSLLAFSLNLPILSTTLFSVLIICMLMYI